MTDIEIMKEYLLLKFREGDMHAVMDAAADIRVMEARDEQRKAIESKRIERSLADIQELARASTKQSSPTDSSHLVAGYRVEEGVSGELRTTPDQTHRGVGFPGLSSCDCTVCAKARAEDLLQSAREDYYRL